MRRFLGILTAAFLLGGVPRVDAVQTPAPSFSQADIQGKLQAPENYRGKPLVLYFWATWCPACRQDVENIVKLHREFYPQGVQFLSVSLDEDLARLEAFVKEHGISFPVLFDGKRWENEIARLYGISATPTFVLIDEEGFIENAGSWSDNLANLLHTRT